MARRLAHLLMPVAVLAALPACEHQEAADHRAAVKAIADAATALQEAPAIGSDASAKWERIARELRGVRGGPKSMQSSRDRLLCQVEWRLADLQWQSGIQDRASAAEAAAQTRSRAMIMLRTLGRLEGQEQLLAAPTTDRLLGDRRSQLQTQEALKGTVSQLSRPVSELEAENAEALQAALDLRMKAAGLRHRASEIDSAAAQPLRAEAAALEHASARLDADIERRTAIIEFQHQLTLDTALLQARQGEEGVGVIDDELELASGRDSALRSHTDRSRSATEAMASSIGESASTLVTLLTGPLQSQYETVTAHLSAAASAAEQAARTGDRESNAADQLASLRTQMGIITIATARSNQLESAIRDLGLVSQLGEVPQSGRWAETRQVLQDQWQQATDVLQNARAAAAQLSDRVGGELGGTMGDLFGSQDLNDNDS